MDDDHILDDMLKPEGEKQPWWNDGDKVAGAATTFVFVIAAVIIVMLLVKFGQWLF